MVKSRWSEKEAAALATPLEQRIYTSRLLGQDPELVMHGGGNTSFKGDIFNIFGEKEPALFIKGSGRDLATIDASGFPAIRIGHLLAMRRLESLGDVEMMNELRTHLADAKAPDPSVEALLHAFLPHRFVDHTHADAVLTLTNQPNSERLIRELYGKRVGIVPYVMPGFRLAKLCAQIFEKDPSVEGMVLMRHGIFSFGESAKESYERMISLVQAAEECIRGRARRSSEKKTAPKGETRSFWMQVLRREFLKRGLGSVLTLDSSETAIAFSTRADLGAVSQRGPLTPDHVIRTKRLPLVVPKEAVVAEDMTALGHAFDVYARAYDEYFSRNRGRSKLFLVQLDALPRIVILPGVGVAAAGMSSKEADIACDVYGHTMPVIMDAESMSGYEALPEGDLFDVEYWVLEQNKLKLGPRRMPLSGKIALVTGGARGIGLAVAGELLDQGAEIFLLDIDENALLAAAAELKSRCRWGNTLHCLTCDVSSRETVASSVEKSVASRGGIDILVVNAGVFPPSHPIEDIPLSEWNRSLEINLGGAFHTVAETLRWMKLQATGGDIVFIASKNVPAPGPSAASYSVAKAGQAQLARVCALEAAAHGIRVNMLHPHLILDTGLWGPEVIAQRAKAYGMTPEQYRTNNLLKTELDSSDVAKATFALVSGMFRKTTGAQIPVDGGSDRTL